MEKTRKERLASGTLKDDELEDDERASNYIVSQDLERLHYFFTNGSIHSEGTHGTEKWILDSVMAIFGLRAEPVDTDGRDSADETSSTRYFGDRGKPTGQGEADEAVGRVISAHGEPQSPIAKASISLADKLVVSQICGEASLDTEGITYSQASSRTLSLRDTVSVDSSDDGQPCVSTPVSGIESDQLGPAAVAAIETVDWHEKLDQAADIDQTTHLVKVTEQSVEEPGQFNEPSTLNKESTAELEKIDKSGKLSQDFEESFEQSGPSITSPEESEKQSEHLEQSGTLTEVSIGAPDRSKKPATVQEEVTQCQETIEESGVVAEDSLEQLEHLDEAAAVPEELANRIEKLDQTGESIEVLVERSEQVDQPDKVAEGSPKGFGQLNQTDRVTESRQRIKSTTSDEGHQSGAKNKDFDNDPEQLFAVTVPYPTDNLRFPTSDIHFQASEACKEPREDPEPLFAATVPYSTDNLLFTIPEEIENEFGTFDESNKKTAVMTGSR
ncbi:hypothetical protein PFICI_14610 [Pestalotiopsis fici W106-1]|uniref:Uncharacterized protein n=1 Tax=Pestalotiopsis fici (strain W106-1 / CGMCC3.15140) TaxID=1229662 RepID=W3WIQ1_PESFW|nr:uncharacterized protein PFICI_14610 [Pestalotiopsis fici W106-1]ETS73664.1 hypothetical protein PFICI_14610 [Pestalotiopsis fici W106-1]